MKIDISKMDLGRFDIDNPDIIRAIAKQLAEYVINNCTDDVLDVGLKAVAALTLYAAQLDG